MKPLFADSSYYVALMTADHHFEQAGFQALLR